MSDQLVPALHSGDFVRIGNGVTDYEVAAIVDDLVILSSSDGLITYRLDKLRKVPNPHNVETEYICICRANWGGLRPVCPSRVLVFDAFYAFHMAPHPHSKKKPWTKAWTPHGLVKKQNIYGSYRSDSFVLVELEPNKELGLIGMGDCLTLEDFWVELLDPESNAIDDPGWVMDNWDVQAVSFFLKNVDDGCMSVDLVKKIVRGGSGRVALNGGLKARGL